MNACLVGGGGRAAAPLEVAEAGEAAVEEVEAEQDLEHEEPRQEHLEIEYSTVPLRISIFV